MTFSQIMKIDDLPRRKYELQRFALTIRWHGGEWLQAMDEIDKLNKQGVKTPLERQLKI